MGGATLYSLFVGSEPLWKVRVFRETCNLQRVTIQSVSLHTQG